MTKRRASFRKRDVYKLDGPFVQLPRDLLSSLAWRSASINCRRLLDFLLLEHMAHAGHENGNLIATYSQLEAFGIGRRLIGAAIEEAERLKLIAVQRGLRRGFARSHPTRFRLTFLPTRVTDAPGAAYLVPPGDEWRQYKGGDASARNRFFSARR